MRELEDKIFMGIYRGVRALVRGGYYQFDSGLSVHENRQNTILDVIRGGVALFVLVFLTHSVSKMDIQAQVPTEGTTARSLSRRPAAVHMPNRGTVDADNNGTKSADRRER